MSIEMGLAYYCYLVEEKNKLNAMRHRQMKRVSRIKRNIPHVTEERALYIAKQEIFKAKVVQKIKSGRSLMRNARLACGFHPQYNGGNNIESIRDCMHYDLVKTNIGWQYGPNDMVMYNRKQIKKIHDDYLVDATLLGIEIINPYVIEDTCKDPKLS